MRELRERPKGGANAEEPVGTRGARPAKSGRVGESACDSRDRLALACDAAQHAAKERHATRASSKQKTIKGESGCGIVE